MKKTKLTSIMNAKRDLIKALEKKGCKMLPDSDLFVTSETDPTEVWERIRDKFELDLGYNAVLTVENDEGKTENWGLIVDDTAPEYEMYEFLYHDDWLDSLGLAQDYSQLFLRDAVDPESLDGIKTSFVFQNYKNFNSAVMELEEMEVNSYISLVLIQDYEVVAEYVLKRRNGEAFENVLYEQTDNFLEDRVTEYEEGYGDVVQPKAGY